MCVRRCLGAAMIVATMAVAVFSCASARVNAATTLTELTSLAEIDLEGNFHYAINLGSDQTHDIGSVRFWAGDSATAPITGYANSMYADPLTYTAVKPEFGEGQDADNLEDVLQGLRWDQGENGAEVTLEATSGETYKLQLFFWLPNMHRFFDVTVDGQPVLDEFNPAATGQYVAYLCSHEFVAGGDSVTIQFTPGDTAYETRSPILNALTLEWMRSLWIPGDTDGDCLVDEDDAAVLAQNWGKSDRQWEEGDFTGDGHVDMADASIMAANWGSHLGEQSANNVPEPCAAAMLLAGLVGLALGRRRLHP